MRVKSIVTIALSLFIVVSVAIVVKRQASDPRVAEPAVARADAVSVASVDQSLATEADVPAESEPEAAGPVTPPPADPSPPASTASEVMPATAPPVSQPVGEVAPIIRISNRRILAFYFHGDVRCATCQAVESLAREAVEEGFPDRVADGSVTFVSVNVDRPENRHFISDFDLVTRTVVIAEEVDGTVGRWENLDAVWQYVGRRTRYLEYVRGVVSRFLEQG
jgi:hypothetical protein